MTDFFNNIQVQFNRAFITDNRWRYIVQGLGNTLVLTFFALVMGVIIGVLVAAIRSSWDALSPTMRRGPGKILFGTINGICKIYLTVIRGTPVVLQIMLIYFVFMASSTNKMLCGIIAFGINSGAYVAEIIRGGIMSVEIGQNEAGRSLGFNYIQTMYLIILPQALKSILPALVNEFIVLLKETAVVGYVGVIDLTRGASIIRGITYQGLFPLIAAALIYLVMVMFFTWLTGKLERRLRNSER